MGYNIRKNKFPHLLCVFGKTLTIDLLLCTFFILASGQGDDNDVTFGQIFLNADLLKQTGVFTDLTNAPACDQSCENICTNQLRGVPVSNMVPCCVRLTNNQTVCQCVIAISGSNDPAKCPESSLALVSNQIYNMSGTTTLFEADSSLCSSLHNSWNIYLGNGPQENNNARPFTEVDTTGVKKIGFQFSAAQNFGPFYIVYYVEFLIICKTKPIFGFGDLRLCEECNKENPIVTILMDLGALQFDNQLFKNLNIQPSCDVTPSDNNQCFSPNCQSQNISEPCCFNTKCIFNFHDNDVCPCPPISSELVLANKIQFDINVDNEIFLFNKPNPPVPEGFIWDVDLDTEDNKMLVGIGTIKSTEAHQLDSFYFHGEFAFVASVFSGFVPLILDNVDSKLEPEFQKTLKF